MSFEQLEESNRHGEPVGLFLFDTGGGNVFTYTDGEETVIFDGQIYVPTPLRRGAFRHTGTLDQTTVEIGLPRTAEIASLFYIFPPSYVVNLSIYQGHANDPRRGFKLTWSGRVLNFAVTDTEAILTCEPITTALQRPGLRRHYQRGCPLVLYGPVCQAEKIARPMAEIGKPAFNVVLASVIGSLDAGPAEFLGGTAEWLTAANRFEIRNILGMDVDGANYRLTLSGPVDTIPAGSTFDIFLGCDHIETVCEQRFNNILNYGGYPWIPTENPVGQISTFY